MFTEMEIKLLRLALDKGAMGGEIDNAAIALIRKLRNRNVNIDDIVGKALKDIPKDYLLWVLNNCDNISPSLENAIKIIVGG